MPALKTRGDYDQLAQIAQRFAREYEMAQRALNAMQQQVNTLQGGDWVGEGARAFYAEMNSAVLPSLERLAMALQSAQRVTQQISREVKQAEDEAALILRYSGGDQASTPSSPGITTVSNPLQAQAASDDSALPKWLTDILSGVFLGDFSDNNSLTKLLAQIGTGFIPIAGQIADVRDIIAAIKDIVSGKEGAWIALGIGVLAIIPGLDVLKGAKVLKPIFKALGDTGTREFVEFLVKNPSKVGRVAKVLGKLLDNNNVVELLAKNPDVVMPIIRKGSPEVIDALAKHGDDAVQVIAKYGDDGVHVAKNYDRYLELAIDPAHKGVPPTPAQLRESGVGLSLEGRGTLPGPLTRDPTGAAEFIDASGVKWDVKGFNSNFPPNKGGFSLDRDVGKIEKEIAQGEHVILDTQNLKPEHVRALRERLEKLGHSDKVQWFP